MDTPEIKYRVSSPSLLSTCKLVLLEKLKQSLNVSIAEYSSIKKTFLFGILFSLNTQKNNLDLFLPSRAFIKYSLNFANFSFDILEKMFLQKRYRYPE